VPAASGGRERASNLYGTASVLKNLVPTLAAYAAVPLVADRSAVAAACLAPLLGLLLYRLTIVMHDCGHATLFTSRKVNDAVGLLLGAVTGISFRRFRARHWEHHRNYGHERDPQGFHYRGLAQMTNGELVRHLLAPLLGVNLRYVFAESYLYPANVARASGGELATLAVVQIALAALVTGLGRHPLAVLLPVASAATFGLFFSQLRGIAEHGVRDGADPRGFVRSHRLDWLGALLLYDLHFNLHEEHHNQPQVPSCVLAALAGARRDSADASRPTMWHTLRGMLR
jgi:omega-6 fatty acid desaturase (delta-12 desaturase)